MPGISISEEKTNPKALYVNKFFDITGKNKMISVKIAS
jgi:hypothetical protein